MKKVMLINKGRIHHYRIPVYSHLSDYLSNRGYALVVVAEGIQTGNSYQLGFEFVQSAMSARALGRVLDKYCPDALIFWTNPKLWILWLMLRARRRGIKLIHWGHRRDQQALCPWLKQFVYDAEHLLDDAIIVYSPEIKEQLRGRFYKKTFVANNTINFVGHDLSTVDRDAVKKKYGIRAQKLVVYLGRLQRRKRIHDLIAAFAALDLPGVGLVIAGPDEDGILCDVTNERVFKLGPIYGRDSLELLVASDVYCLPGAIGLNIVDAFYCGLPIVTERVRHGPEAMYFHEGVNGYAVDEGDVHELAERLRRILLDETLRARLSKAARAEIESNGHIDRMCGGFLEALDHTFESSGGPR